MPNETGRGTKKIKLFSNIYKHENELIIIYARLLRIWRNSCLPLSITNVNNSEMWSNKNDFSLIGGEMKWNEMHKYYNERWTYKISPDSCFNAR